MPVEILWINVTETGSNITGAPERLNAAEYVDDERMVAGSKIKRPGARVCPPVGPPVPTEAVCLSGAESTLSNKLAGHLN